MTNAKNTTKDATVSVLGLGMMGAVEIVKDKGTKEEFPAGDSVGPRILAAGTERGLFSRVRGDVYVIAPPIVSTEAEIDQIVQHDGDDIGCLTDVVLDLTDSDRLDDHVVETERIE